MKRSLTDIQHDLEQVQSRLQIVIKAVNELVSEVNMVRQKALRLKGKLDETKNTQNQ